MAVGMEQLIMQMMAQQNQQGQGGGENPYAQAGQQGLSALSNFFAGAEGRKQQKYGFSQRKYLSELARQMMTGGDVINPKMMTQLMSQFRQSQQPAFADMLRSAGRTSGGPTAGQTQSIYARQRLPIEGGYLAGLQRQNIGLTENRNMNLLRFRGQLAGS